MDKEQELRRNVKELQEQLQIAYQRIKVLQEELYVEHNSSSNFKSGMSGWDLMDDPDYR